MSTRRRNRPRAKSIDRAEDGKKKKEKDPAVAEIEDKHKMLRKAFTNHYRGRDSVVTLDAKAKIVVNYEDDKGRKMRSPEMSKRDYNVLHTKLLDAQKELIKDALNISGKKDPKQSKSRITVYYLNTDFENAFDELLGTLPRSVQDNIDALRTDEGIPVSRKLISNLVRYHVYQQGLYKGVGKMTKEGEYSKGSFVADALLNDLLRYEGSAPGEETILQIQLGSRIKHLMDERSQPDDWKFIENVKLDDPTKDNRLDRYNTISDSYRSEWESENSKKKTSYPDTIELDAARAVLLDEGVKLRGNPRDVIEDKELAKTDDGLYITASVDFVAEIVNDFIEGM